MIPCPACGKLATRCHIIDQLCTDCPDKNPTGEFPLCLDYHKDSECKCDIEDYQVKCIKLNKEIGRLLSIIDELTADPNNRII